MKSGYGPRKASDNQCWSVKKITVTGPTKVGKGAAFEELRKIYENIYFHPPYTFVSAGDIMRKRSDELGFETIRHFAAHADDHPEEGHDKWLDDQIVEYGKKNRVAIEGRVVHCFVPDAFHVLFRCPLDVRAQWVANKSGRDPALEASEIEERDIRDTSRFKRSYPGSIWPPEAFHLVIDTNKHRPDDIARMIFKAHTDWVAKIPRSRMVFDHEYQT